MLNSIDTVNKTNDFYDVKTRYIRHQGPAFNINLPLFNSKVPAGFPSPADDHVETRLNPNEYLIDQEDSTFFVTIHGESMIDVGLMPGDKVIVDKARTAKTGNIIVAVVDGEITIKVLGKQKNGFPKLIPANHSGAYHEILINADTSFEVWGVVIGAFRRYIK